MVGNVTVGARQKDYRLIQHRILCKISSGKRAPFDEVYHQKARFVMDHCGRNTRRMRSLTGGKFIEPHDLVHGNVGADAHHGFATAILNQKVAICYTAVKRRNRSLALPDGKVSDPVNRRHTVALRKNGCGFVKFGRARRVGPPLG